MGRRVEIAVALAAIVLFSLPTRATTTRSDPEQVVQATVVEAATTALCGKRFALLGELPSHGEARGFQLKAEIVRRLVQRCGFRTLVFEAPVYEFLGPTFASQHELDDAIGGFWRTQELAPWRAWLFEEAAKGRLSLRGMDDQVSATAERARRVLPDLVASHVPAEQATMCRASVQRNLNWSYDETHDFDAAEQQRLDKCALDAATPKQPVLLDGLGDASLLLLNFASYVGRQVERKGAVSRDERMFRNAAFFANEKAVVWTATVHAARQQGVLKEKPVGTWLDEMDPGSVGVIGFTALGGRSSMAARPATELAPAPPASLEARALQVGGDEVFVDAASLREWGGMESRLLGKFQTADWSQYFDGVVVIREEQAPSFPKAN